LIALLFFPLVGWGQGLTSDQRKANTLVIELNEPNPIEFLSNRFLDAGYGIERVDPQLGLIETTPISIGSGKYRINARVKGNTVEFTHFYQLIITVYGVTNDSWTMQQLKNTGVNKKTTERILAFVQAINPNIQYFER
jgi:hypothetical protein